MPNTENKPFITKQTLLDTHQRIRPYIHKTPVLTSQTIGRMSGAQVYFKCENFQKMGAFKMRGATNAILQLSDGQRARGVASHSSGNFAQAVSLAAQNLGVKAYIVMPSDSPEVKKAAVRDYGGKITECTPTLQAREDTVAKVIERTGATFLHPYNDYAVIAGQATAAMELLEEIPDLDYIIPPVGGGGLAAGTALAAHFFSPKTKVTGAEPLGADDAWKSLKKGEIVLQAKPQTIADGLRTNLGDKTFAILSQYLERIILVEESEIINALRLLMERMKIVVEPSGAVPLAALLKEKESFAGKRVGIIVSGGNVDLKQLGGLFG
ncbi:MAG TPA: pyridoxal-phosphate dependent enzyme [Bacteroidetes bacterium]|nr:pyridoxal-phosphate dependent enzyme [Bacteroidota bacterium]